MNFLKNMSIGPRLTLAFGAVIAVAVAVVLVGISRLSNITESLTLVGSDRVPKVMQLVDITDNVNLIARELRNTLIWDDPAKVATALEVVAKARETIAKTLESLTPTITSDEGKKRLAAVVEARASYVPVQLQFVDLVRAGKKEDAEALLAEKLRPTQLAYFKALDELKDMQIGLITKAAKEGEADYADAKLLMLALLAAMVALGGVCGWLITRSITRPINEAVKVAQTVAAGDLTSKIEVTTRDETGQLLTALKNMNDSLVGIVGNVRQSSDSIATGSAQIATGNADLSQRTEEQASNLQQTAASMEQLTATVKQNSDTARQANQLATGASAAATKGGVVVGQVVGTMQEITASSKKISDIISVIDGIAFQTNILALNAAVEAARAGEQGRGFAVVASEVRSLAQRSAGAAKEIKTLIGESVEKVETGSKLVDDAGKSMEDIVNQVRRVTDLIAEISSASVEQTQGIGQVGDAITQLDQVTQQNAALVEESAAAAESLSQQAARLAEIVSVFKLGHGQSSAAPVAAVNTAAVERRGPNRAANVTRPQFAAKAPAKASTKAPAGAATPVASAVPAKTGTDDWASF